MTVADSSAGSRSSKLHFVAIPLPAFLGLRSVTEAGMPMALSHVATAGWLVVKGLGARSPGR